MILILTDTSSSRLLYAAGVLAGPWEAGVEVTTDKKRWEGFAGIKFSYSSVHATGGISVSYSGCLDQGVDEFAKITTGEWHSVPTLFHADNQDVPFDLFTAIFFLASRLEEYRPFEADSMGRFEAASSFAGKRNWHQRPLIDEWRALLTKLISARWPENSVKLPSPQFRITIDIDSAFAYRHKGLYRALGGFAKDFIGANFHNAGKRLLTLLRVRPDHYATYDHIIQRCEQHGVEPIWFFLLADFGEFDKNVSHTSAGLRRLITSISETGRVGIHPGIGSHRSEEVLQEEIKRLREITGREVLLSRQHYLKITFPDTYQRLIAAGIREDFTMGYSSATGFRLGTSFPVFWYDLNREQQTNLLLIPFCAMDTTMQKYMKLSPDDAVKHLSELHAVIHRTGGQMTILWHNESLSEEGRWKGWSAVFDAAMSLSAGKQ